MESSSECVEVSAAHTMTIPESYHQIPNSGIPITDPQNSLNPQYFLGQS